MADTLVPTVRTTPTLLEFAIALLRVWPEATKHGAGILWAHFAGETAEGHHCYGWNLGNVKWTKGCGYDYQALKKNKEFVDGKYIKTPSTDPASWFRVYPSLEAGMTAFVNSKRTGQWRTTWPFVEQGEPEAYARELKRLRYYTAPVEDYVASMRAKLAKWMASTAFDDAKGSRPTLPAVEPYRAEEEPAIVHPWHYRDPDSEPPGAA